MSGDSDMCGSSDHVEADCPSGSSDCSGADARRADKAPHGCIEDGTPIQILPDGRIVPIEAAVSPRSSDGPLPCPVCKSELEYQGGYGFGGYAETERYECNTCSTRVEIRANSWQLAQEARGLAKQH